MGRRNSIVRIAIVLLMVLAALPAMASTASALYKKGQNAEIRQDYVAAYSYYLRAYNLKPENLSYRIATLRTRFEAGAQLVDRGRQLRDQGKLTEALAEFQKAATTDPSSLIAREEIRRTQAMIEAAGKTQTSDAIAPQ
jgi:general secretion pathway protein D